MEEMVHRERLRSWKRLTVEILNLASQVTRDPSIIGQVGDTLSDYYNMVVHNKGPTIYIAGSWITLDIPLEESMKLLKKKCSRN